MKQYISILILLCITAAATARDIDCRPGGLALCGDISSDTELRLTGGIDVADFFHIAGNAPALKRLDLSGCTIAAYEGDPIDGITRSAANTIPQGVFAASAIEEIIFPTGQALIISDGAFMASALRKVELPDADVSIGTGAFAACPYLTEVTVRGRTSVGAYAFRSCPSLASASLAEAVSIGEMAFASCKALKKAEFGAGLTEIGRSAFENTSLSEASLGATKITSVADRTFAGNSVLKSVSLPSGVATLGKGCFADCRSLRDFTVPSTCSLLPDYALKDTGLTTIELGNICEMGDFALKGADNLRHVAMPAHIEYIGNGAMEGMTGLKVINISDTRSVPQLGEDVWAGVDAPEVTLIVRSDMTESFGNADQWKEFRILDQALSSTGIIETGGEISIKAVAAGLLISSTGSDIAAVEIYNASGVLLAHHRPAAATYTADLTGDTTSVYIIRISLADGTAQSFKIVR